jgi:hypothetical protein
MNVRRFSIPTALGLAGLLLNHSAQAADAPKWYESTKVSGFADGYYKLNLDGRKGAAASTMDAVFDKHENTFAIQGGKVELSSMDGMGVVDLYFGDYGAALQPVIGAPEVAVLGQAYISQLLGPVTVTLGRFFTHLGYEVNDSVANLNFTRGLVFGNLPFYHQGLKLAYSPMEGLGLMAMLDNGNSVNYNASEETAGGFQISYTGIKGLSTYLNYYYQPLPGSTWEKNHFIDLVASYALSEKLTLAGEYLYISTIGASDTDTAGNATGAHAIFDPSTGKLVPYSPKLQGYAIYVDYATPMEGLSITPRFEQVFSPDGFTAAVPGQDGGLTKFDYTLTARYTKGMVMNWLELRADASDDAIFPAPVNDPAKAAYSEMALTWGAAYKF